jgi:hypothetical protein
MYTRSCLYRRVRDTLQWEYNNQVLYWITGVLVTEKWILSYQNAGKMDLPVAFISLILAAKM